MQPTKQERDALNRLSLALFGSESKWRKLQENTPIFAGYEEYGPKTREYKQAYEAHLAELADGSAQGEFTPPRRAIYRRPTVSEVFRALEMQADLLIYANGSAEEIADQAAYDFLQKQLPVALKLVVGEQETQEFEEEKAKLPKDYHEWIDKMVTADLPVGGGVQLSGRLFLKALAQKVA